MTESYTIDQAIHGYKNGHRMISSSISLSKEADAKMQVLTDLLSSKMLGETDSYLTGYPIRSINRYVLSRTWAALDAGRPGAVWTHSLLLDYSTLGQIENPAPLTALLRQPRHSEKTASLQPIVYFCEHQGINSKGHPSRDSRVWETLAQMYGHNRAEKILIPTVNQAEDEELCLALWRQMWPALRRNFAFCTRPNAQLDKVESNCVLTFGEQPALELIDSQLNISDRAAVDKLAYDLDSTSNTPLRSFLGLYAVDIEHPRKYVPQLISCFEHLENPQKISALLSGSEYEEGGFRRLRRDTLFRAISSTDSIEHLLETLRIFQHEPMFVTEDEFKSVTIDKRLVFKKALPQILKTTKSSKPGEFGYAVFESIAKETPIRKLAGATDDVQVNKLLFKIRPGIASVPKYWTDRHRHQLLKHCLKYGLEFDQAMLGLSAEFSKEDASLLIDSHPECARNRLAELMISKQQSVERYDLYEFLLDDKKILSEVLETASIVFLDFLELLARKLVVEDLFSQFSSLENGLTDDLSQSELLTYPNCLTAMVLTALSIRSAESGAMLSRSLVPTIEMVTNNTAPKNCLAALKRNITKIHRKGFRISIIGAAVDQFGGASNLRAEIFQVITQMSIKEDIADIVYKEAGSKGLRNLIMRLEMSNVRSRRKDIELCESRLERSYIFWPFF